MSKKLGIKSGHVLYLLNAPADYEKLLGELPPKVQIGARGSGPADLIHFFSKDREELKNQLPRLISRMTPNGAIWISWPKKASGIASTVTEDIVRQLALPLGLVDIKVCAVDEVWSGLKLVVRRQLRKVG